jgi:D-xylose transport system substrate-binding protein
LAAVICIAQGEQSMTVYKPITQEADRAAEEAVRLASGSKVEAETAIRNGKIEVPTILLKPIVVSRANIKETVVKDGFQTLTSINRDLPEGERIH